MTFLRRWPTGSLGLAAALWTTFSFAADEVPVVTVSNAGPDRDIPNRSFYVAGSAPPDAVRVQVFVVRTTDPWLFGGGEGRSCSEVATALEARLRPHVDTTKKKPDAAKPKAPSEPAKPAPSTPTTTENPLATFEGLTSGTSESLIPETVWVAPAWLRGDKDPGKESAFKIYVGPSDDFYRAGARYCLHVYREEKTKKVDSDSVNKALTKLSDDLTACKIDDSTCANAAQARFDEAMATLEPNAKENLYRLALASLTSLRAAAVERAKVGKILDAWPKPTAQGAQYFPLLRSANTITAQSDALGAGTTDLLVRVGGKVFEHSQAGKPTEYFVVNAQSGKNEPVTRGMFTTDFGNIELIAPNDVHFSLKVNTDDLKVETTGLSLRDLLELQRHRLRVGTDFLAFGDIRRKLASALDRGDISEADRKTLDELSKRLGAMQQLAKAKVTKKDEEKKPRPGEIAAAHTIATPVATAPIEPMLALWMASFTTTEGMESPLSELADALRLWLLAHDKWTAQQKDLAIAKENAQVVAAIEPVGTRFQYTQKNWFFSYVTPVVGYAGVLNDSERFPIAYVAAQVHFVPNLVNEPLWSNGRRDFWRFFAPELGVSLPATKYGPGDRFRGVNGLPPVFIGGTIHVLPYTGVSVGGVLLERRASTLADQKADVVFPLYIGVNVQANVPEIVRNLSSKTTLTTE